MSNETGSAQPPSDQDPFAPVAIDLKNPSTAVFLAWLIPGAGHLYQGRRGKGILFLVCILSIYFLGLSMGGGRVVYAKWDSAEKRLPLLCQLGVGLPTLPAFAQAYLVKNHKQPMEFLGTRLMAPPLDKEENASLHRKYGYLFEMGTLYTMIAGLLNVLVIYDAGAGPVWMLPDSEKKKRAKDKDDESESASESNKQDPAASVSAS
ncbi:hypothetical protein DTL21_16895 [Bremerella cremea]|uniref:DUF6677 domain-containing protein n=1 Tax=Blastopirellula marina TaxID=124 RepID=A0A2S8FIB0_9BACT|nr:MULTISPECIES: DUF6677 family protein [Pirellulaceae]PQO31929.1 hypothetical protein C5Y83_16880 [Blastopirellula marina]RCS44995.1 hypothetical protein DTL21_16895 [Bremerella cremea]